MRLRLALGVLTVLACAPVARADEVSWSWRGGCVSDAVESSDHPGEYTGAVAVAAVLLRDTTPAPGTVRCVLTIDAASSTVLGPDHTDSGALVDAAPVTYAAAAGAHVTVCTVVTFDGEPGQPEHTSCPGPVDGGLLSFLSPIWDYTDPIPLDPMVCPLVASLGSAPPLSYVDTQGDVWLRGHRAGDKVWDCPPYDY